MKLSKFLIPMIGLLLFPLIGMATPYTARISASSTNIPTSFSTGATSLVITGVAQPSVLLIDNQTNGEIAVNCSSSSTSAPSNSSVNNIYVQANESWVIDYPYSGSTCYIRSNTGSAITTGTFVITLII